MPVTKTKTEVPIAKLQPNAFQYEILELVSKQRSNVKKVEVLKEYRNDALISLFIWNFDESVVSILPPGAVPYADPSDQPAAAPHGRLVGHGVSVGEPAEIPHTGAPEAAAPDGDAGGCDCGHRPGPRSAPLAFGAGGIPRR